MKRKISAHDIVAVGFSKKATVQSIVNALSKMGFTYEETLKALRHFYQTFEDNAHSVRQFKVLLKTHERVVNLNSLLQTLSRQTTEEGFKKVWEEADLKLSELSEEKAIYIIWPPDLKSVPMEDNAKVYVHYID